MAEDPTDPTDPRRLLVWALPAFHAALLVALLVAGLYATGRAGEVLGSLETWIGVLAYLYLWAVTWWTNRRWLAAVGESFLRGRPPARPVLRSALRWGAATGLGVFAAPFLVAVAFFLAGGGLGAIPFLALAAAVGAALSLAIGGLVGGLFAGLDLLLLRASDVLLVEPTRDDRGPAVED